jgi:CRISPR/Cas system CMR subunit Cmr4 (Cas7 group RAMP superfamily)
MTPDDVLRFAPDGEEVLQLGGKATTGRGRRRGRLHPLEIRNG